MRHLQCLFKKFTSYSSSVFQNRSKWWYSTFSNPTHKAISNKRDWDFNEAVKSELKHGATFTENDWKTFTEKLISREIVVPDSYINVKNVSGVILRLCAEFRLFDVGKAYFQLLKSRNEHSNLGILSRYLRLCAHNRKYALENEDEVMEIYRQVRKAEVTEPLIGERCIAAVCLYEKHWKEAFDVFEEIKLTGNPSPLTHFLLAEASFRFGDIDRGWQVLRSCAARSDSRPNPDCYIALIERYEHLRDQNKLRLEDIEEMFHYLEEFHFNLPSQEIVVKLDKLIHSLSNDKFEWSLKETYIPKNAVCSSCRRLLERVVISSEEFQEMRQTFSQKAVVGKNIFLKSTPEEIESFRIFLKKAGPYDIVIDGLNVAYARGPRDPLSLANTLKSVVAHFVRHNQKVLVLGRQHMKHWPKEHMLYIYENAKVFLALNLSQDDPLLLYAALKGGEKTKFISRDLMRSHLFSLEESRIKLLFRKWLVSHQYMLGYFTKFGRPSVLPPLAYRPTAQKMLLGDSEICWHVPYDLEYLIAPPSKREPPPRWLCIRRVPRRSNIRSKF